MVLRRFKVREHERGLLFRDREFKRVLRPGRHWVWDPLFKVRVDVVSVRDVWLNHKELDVVAKSGALGDEARVVDLKDHERAVEWVDGRIEGVLKPGLYALWTVFHDVKVETFDARAVRFDHTDLAAIVQTKGSAVLLEMVTVEAGHAGLFFKDGRHEATLAPGAYALWKGVAKTRVLDVDLRELVVDVAGQDIMTADKVTLRLNAVVTYKVADPVKAATTVEDYRQALYREAQLALRAVVGTRELDALLSDKDAVARELGGIVRVRVAGFGVEVVALGIRDVILPGEMKDLMNEVTEAKKAAEAALITRRSASSGPVTLTPTATALASPPATASRACSAMARPEGASSARQCLPCWSISSVYRRPRRRYGRTQTMPSLARPRTRMRHADELMLSRCSSARSSGSIRVFHAAASRT
jgi:regulator of protease activity HflC (stomatin/prohibitin superfamily)